MSNSIKVSARPPLKKSNDLGLLDEMMDSFVKNGDIDGDKSSQRLENKEKEYPWNSAREDVYKVFNLRLNEEYSLKLDFLSSKIRKSKHSICLESVKSEIDKLLSELENGNYRML